MRPRCLALLVSAFVVACGSSGSDASSASSTGAGAGATSSKCFDASGKPTSSCALTPSIDVCAMGDANACTPLTETEVYADDGKNGVCIHLVFTNDCGAEIFGDTCIEYNDPIEMKPAWQCWTSSVLAGATIDVSQCHATGNVFSVATESSGQLDVLEAKCSAPM